MNYVSYDTRRIGHLHYSLLQIFRNIVIGLPEFSIELQGVFIGCALGRNSNDFFSSNKSRSKGILDLIHLGVCGMMSMELVKGEKYYVMFIDEYSMKT